MVTSAGVLAIAAWRGEQYVLLRLAGGSGGGGGAAWDTPPPAPAGVSAMLTPGSLAKPPSTTMLPSAIGLAPSGSQDALKRAAAEATQVATGVELFEFVSDEFIDVREIKFRFFFCFLVRPKGKRRRSIAPSVRVRQVSREASRTRAWVLRRPKLFSFSFSLSPSISPLSFSLICASPLTREKKTK